MFKVRLQLSDWLYNAGIVGIVKILEESQIECKRNNNYIEFEEKDLESFEEKYFNYFIKTYEKFTTWYKIVKFQEDFIEKINIDDFSDKHLSVLNDQIERMKKILTKSSYKSAYVIIKDLEFDLINEEKRLKKIKKTKKQDIKDVMSDVENQINVITNIINYLRKEEVKRIIVAKNIIYEVIQQFWEGVSFLHKDNNKKDMYEVYEEYFLKQLKGYIEKDKSKFKYNCFTCENKIKNLSKPESYDLTWIKKIGADMSRKSSHFWNFNGDAYICPVCNLVYSCIPAGFSVINGKGIFINQNSSIDTLIKINKHSLSHTKTFEELEEEGYFNIVDNIKQNEVEQFEREIENIQIVKFDGANERRPYSFNLLSKNKLQLIYKNHNKLKKLIKIYIKDGKEYINLYREVIDRLYGGKNQFDLINKLLVLSIEGKFNKTNLIDTIIQVNNNFIGGRDKRKMVYYKEIENFKNYGLDLRKEYEKCKSTNKIGGITYRLLNALKIKNQAKFMDTLINSYMYLNKQIPINFIEALKDIDKFQTIGYCFLVGLQGEEIKESKNENGKGEK